MDFSVRVWRQFVLGGLAACLSRQPLVANVRHRKLQRVLSKGGLP